MPLQPRHKRIKRSWRTDLIGKTTLVIRYVAEPIKFASGKTAIAVGDKNSVPEVLSAVLAAKAAWEPYTLLRASASLTGTAKKLVQGKR